jgi:hypothetical protein
MEQLLPTCEPIEGCYRPCDLCHGRVKEVAEQHDLLRHPVVEAVAILQDPLVRLDAQRPHERPDVEDETAHDRLVVKHRELVQQVLEAVDLVREVLQRRVVAEERVDSLVLVALPSDHT